MNNTIEIVYGDSLAYTIKQCDFVGNKVIKFDKFLSFADLSNIENNVIRLSEDFCNSIYSEIYYNFDVIESMESLNKELEDAAKRKYKIRVWSTHQEIESYLTFLYVCNYLYNNNCDLYVLFSDEYDKECYAPACMNEPELKELAKLEHKLSKDELFKYATEWKELVKENSKMRIIENGKIKSVSLDYYNDVILNRLNELGETKLVSLSADLMRDYHMYDIFITYLIKRVIKLKKIKILKEEKNLWSSVITTNNKDNKKFK